MITTEREEWNGLSFKEPSKGVVASDGGGNGVVLWAVGAHLRFEIEEIGLTQLADLGLDDAPVGVSVWEGRYVWQPGNWEHPDDGDMLPSGKFRPPTDDEWQAIRSGVCPWTEVSGEG